MKRNCLGFFLILLFCSTQAQAMSFGVLLKQYQSPSKNPDFPLGQGNRCARVFQSIGQAHLLQIRLGDSEKPEAPSSDSHVFEANAGFSVKIDSVPIDRPAKVQQDFFENAMAQWIGHGYSAKQVQLLREINDQLPPHRVSWVSFRFDRPMILKMRIPPEHQGLSSIRIFDASTPLTHVFSFPVRYHETARMEEPNNLKESLTPIELSPRNQEAGYLLPFRPVGLVKPVYLWHIGIGTNVKNFNGGLLVMFRHVAEALENNYNKSYYKTFKSTKPLDKLDMNIISSAKPDLVPYYTKLGFEVLDPYTGRPAENIMVVNSKGEVQATPEMPLLPDGMVLIGMKGSDFIRRFFDFQDTPHILVENKDGTFELGKKSLEAEPESEARFVSENRQTHNSLKVIPNKEVLRQKIVALHQMSVAFSQKVAEFVQNNPQIHQMNKKEQEFFAENKDYAELMAQHRKLAIALYQAVIGLPKSLRTSEWHLMELTVISYLTDFPIEGYQGFKPGPSGRSLDIIEALEKSLNL